MPKPVETCRAVSLHDALLRAYVEKPKLAAVEQKARTLAGTFLHDTSNYRKDLARPTGIEPVLRVPETLNADS